MVSHLEGFFFLVPFKVIAAKLIFSKGAIDPELSRVSGWQDYFNTQSMTYENQKHCMSFLLVY